MSTIMFTTTLPVYSNGLDCNEENFTAEHQQKLLQQAITSLETAEAFGVSTVEMWSLDGEIVKHNAWFIGYNDNTHTTAGVHRICANFLVKIGESYILARSQTLSLDEFKWARFNSDPTVISGDLLDRVLVDEYTIVDAEKISSKVREILTLVNNI